MNQVAKRAILRNAEDKYVDTSNTGQSISTNMLLLSSTVQGTADSGQRIGDEITIRNLELYFQLKVGSTNANIRVVVFQWKLDTTITGAPTNSAVLQTTGTLSELVSSYNHDEMSRSFTILYDQSFGLNTVDNNTVFRRLKLYPTTKKIHYVNGSTTGIGHIYMYLFSDNVVNLAQCNYYTRLNFVDT